MQVRGVVEEGGTIRPHSGQGAPAGPVPGYPHDRHRPPARRSLAMKRRRAERTIIKTGARVAHGMNIPKSAHARLPIAGATNDALPGAPRAQAASWLIRNLSENRARVRRLCGCAIACGMR
jgi:hypothetical protein